LKRLAGNYRYFKSTYKKANLDLLIWWFGNFVGKTWELLGITWEKLFFSWDFRGTFSNGFQQVTIIVGNFVGITFFFVGITWEKVREKLGEVEEKLNLS
jgi:hypothetical protein